MGLTCENDLFFQSRGQEGQREGERERERERDLALYKGQFQHAATVSKIVHKQLVQQSVK